MKNYYLLLFTAFTFSSIFAQQSTGWTVEYSKSKTFIENAGQFDAFEDEQTGEILYAVDFGFSRIFFGEKGVSYDFREILKKSKEERKAIMNQPAKSFEDHKQKEELIGKFMIRTDEVNMQWHNMNAAPEVVGVDMTPDYHSYTYSNEKGETVNVNHVKAYKKLVYKNVYNNIDIEYQVHPEVGIKYAYIVHPGADLEQLEVLFDREFSLVNGEVHVTTLFGDIIDHAPLTFYKDNQEEIIGSEYKLRGNAVTFGLDQYDVNRTIVIDPWVQTPNDPNSDWDVVWELDKDGAGNVYVIAGIMPMQLLKYNSAGVLQWTHNTPYDTTAWLGTMATDNVGNSYVTNGTDYMIQKVDAAGGLVWNNNNPSGGNLSTEFWNISFNCDQTKLLVGGTGGNLDIHGRVYDVDMNSGNINSSVQVTQAGNLFSIPPNIQEVRAMCPSPSGKYYFLTLDTIGYLSDNLTLCPNGSSSLVMDDHGVGWGYKCENWRYNNTGIKAIRADANFVYVNKGDQLQKRSLVDFSLISSVGIPGGTLQSVFLGGNVSHNAGIDIDDCGNVYVGSTNGVYKFDSNLNQLASYPTTFNVYDVRVSPTGDIIACGGTGDSGDNVRSGGVQSFAAGACSPLAFTCCDATVCIPDAMCVNDAPVTLTPASAGGTWSGTGVNASGVFDPATAGPGTHIITYTLLCGSESISIVVDPCATIDICEEANGDLTASGGDGNYTWSTGTITSSNVPINTEQECIDCPTATPQYFFGIYTGCDLSDCPVQDTTWTQYATGITTPAPSGYPIQIVDGNGTTTVINNAGELVACAGNPCTGVTITMNIDSQTDVSCAGANDGAATVSATGGTGPYQYVWTPGSLSGPSQTGLAGGLYSVAIQDNNGCPGSGSVTINEPAPITPSAAMVSNPTSCGASDGVIEVCGLTISQTYDDLSYNDGSGTVSLGSFTTDGSGCYQISGLAADSYSNFVVTLGSCTGTDAGPVSLSDPGGPTITNIATVDPSCPGACDGSMTVTATGGTAPYNYQWYDGLGNPVGTNSATLSNICAGNYSVEVSDAGGGGGTVQLFYDDFESGAAGWTLNVSMAAEGADPNFFVVNDNEGGVAPPGCGIATNGDATLHVTSVFNPSGGAAYDAGGLCGFLFCPETHRQSETPVINTVGQTNLTLNFDYIANGAIPNDQATVWYNDGSGWTQLGAALFSGTAGCSPQGTWTAYTSALPASCENIPNLQIAIRWDNNDDGAGTDPSVAINNLEVTSTSAGGSCTATQSSSITDPSSLTITASLVSDPSTCGGTDGAIQVCGMTASTSYTDLSYDDGSGTVSLGSIISDGSGCFQITGLAADTYTNFVLTAGSCTYSDAGPVTLTDPAAATITASLVSDPTSCGATDGVIQVCGMAASTSYTDLSYDDGSGTISLGSITSDGSGCYQITGLAAGSYSNFVLTDGACTSTDAGPVALTDPAAVSITATMVSNPSNCGGTDGIIQVCGMAASTSYTDLSYNDGSGTISLGSITSDGSGCYQITGLAAGSYSNFVLTDGACTSTDAGPVSLTDPGSPTPSATLGADPSSCGATDGTIQVCGLTASTTYDDLSYNDGSGIISLGSVTTDGSGCYTITGLVAGSYTSFSVTLSGCTGSDAGPVTLTDPSAAAITASVVSDPTTCGGTDGVIQVCGMTASTTYTDLSYDDGTGTVSLGSITSDGTGCYQITGLAAGSYSNFVLTDGACTSTDAGPLTLTDPGISITATLVSNPTACGMSDGVIQVCGLAASTTYDDLSYDNTGGTVSLGSITTDGSGCYQITGLAADSYSNFVVTLGACSGSDAGPIALAAAGGPTVSVVSTTDVSCFGGLDGEATVSATGGTSPYTYSWSPAGGSAATATGLSSGTYTVTVTDNVGCTGTQTVTISQPSGIVITETISDANCGSSDGSISVTVTGGTGSMSYLWAPNGETTSSITGLSGGNYGVTVTDANGCSAAETYTVSVVGSLPVVATPTVTTINNGESVQLNATGATNYTWTPADGLDCTDCSNPIATPTTTTSYIVTGDDGSGCFGVDTVYIIVETVCGEFFIPNIFSPNGMGDPENEQLCMYGNCISDVTLRIFNRWGQLVFETIDPTLTECWDGTYKGKPAMTGVYVYTLTVEFFDGNILEKTGNITLSR